MQMPVFLKAGGGGGLASVLMELAGILLQLNLKVGILLPICPF